MFQTSPASAGLGKLGLEPSVGTQDRSRDTADSFSQEFDKQVKNLDKRDSDGSEPAADSARPASDKQTAEAKEGRPDGTPEQRDSDAQGKDGQRQDGQRDGSESGKALPQSVAEVPLLEEPSDDLSAEEGVTLPAEQEIAALLNNDEAEAFAAGDEESPIQPFAFALGGSAPEELAVTEEVPGEMEEELSPLRLRDSLTQRFAGLNGEKGAESAIVKDGKFDLQNLLSGQPLPARGPAAAEGAGTLGAASAVGPAQGSVSTTPVAMTLAVPLQQKGWDQAMGERVTWMARSNIQEAQVQLNPRELGPIEIKITLKQDQAHVQFVAHHATTREALEAAMPRLRDMLNESGLNLAQSDVSQHSFRDNDRNAAAGSSGTGVGGGVSGEEDEGESVAVSHVGQVNPRGIDYFA